MLQQEQPEFCNRHRSTGERTSLHRAHSSEAGLRTMQWDGEETAEVGRRGDTGEVVVRVDPDISALRSGTLLGDPSKAKVKLGWTPTTTLEELVAEMVAADVEEAKKRLSSAQGFCCGGNANDVDYFQRSLRFSGHGEWLVAPLPVL